MKKFISFLIAGLLLFSTPAFAADGVAAANDASAADAGITPDSILYTADKLFEDIQLLLTFDSEAEAELLLQFAQERIAEAKVMTEQEKTEFVQTAVDDYLSTLQQAQDKVLEVVTDESQSEEVKDELNQELEDTSVVDEDISENLEEEQQEEVSDTVNEVSFTANVVKGMDVEAVKALRDKGLGFGQIAHVVTLAESSGKTVDEISDLLLNGKKGIGELAKEFGTRTSQLNHNPKSDEQDDTSVPGETDGLPADTDDGQPSNTTDEGTAGQEGSDSTGTLVGQTDSQTVTQAITFSTSVDNTDKKDAINQGQENKQADENTNNASIKEDNNKKTQDNASESSNGANKGNSKKK